MSKQAKLDSYIMDIINQYSENLTEEQKLEIEKSFNKKLAEKTAEILLNGYSKKEKDLFQKEMKDSFRNLLLFGRNERYVNTETGEITNITNYQITCDCDEL